jgi:hypothetical protein
MREIFYPTTVAVIGVSPKPDNLGRNIVGNLVEYGFDGIVYAVGPSGGTIETRRIYKSVGDIPDHIDLAVILTPAVTVPQFWRSGQKGIRRAIIETAGCEYADPAATGNNPAWQSSTRYASSGRTASGRSTWRTGSALFHAEFVARRSRSSTRRWGGHGKWAMANEGGTEQVRLIGNTLNISSEVLEYLIEDEGAADLHLPGKHQDGRS